MSSILDKIGSFILASVTESVRTRVSKIQLSVDEA